MATIGLVLGAGGLVGQAFEAGVLAALEWDLGWDPRTADVIVGTSAGSLTGALLRLGLPAAELSTWMVGGASEAPLLDDLAAIQDDLPDFNLRFLFGKWRLPSWRDCREALIPQPLNRRLAMLFRLMPVGTLSVAESLPLQLIEGDLPSGLWICATRLRDGQRVILSQDRGQEKPVGLMSAVMASCAIPSYFAPVTIDGQELIDGGVSSPTNADVLADQNLDLVVVVSPMSLPPLRASGLDTWLRWEYGRQLRAEIRLLKQRGAEIVLFEPGRGCARVMRSNFMARGRGQRVAQSAFFETGAQAADPRVRRLFAPFSSRTTSLTPTTGTA